jgi:hypothetical protein
MFNYDRIMATILADAPILALLSSYGGNKAVFGDRVVPKDLPAGSTSINFYHAPVNPTLEYEDEVYTLNCRGPAFTDSRNIQNAVVTAFNRKASQTDGFYTCNVLAIIPPADQTDNYNGPVEVRIKKR